MGGSRLLGLFSRDLAAGQSLLMGLGLASGGVSQLGRLWQHPPGSYLPRDPTTISALPSPYTSVLPPQHLEAHFLEASGFLVTPIFYLVTPICLLTGKGSVVLIATATVHAPQTGSGELWKGQCGRCHSAGEANTDPVL